MTAIGEALPPHIEMDCNCDSRKFLSKHVYPVTRSDPPMYEVGACLTGK
jgi:hypothetical protein